MNIHIRKGHDLKLVGAPAKSVQDINDGTFIKLHPSDFPGVKPKLLVKVGETLKKERLFLMIRIILRYYLHHQMRALLRMFASGKEGRLNL